MQGPVFQHSRVLRECGFRHAFFTRQGGVSEGPYRSLNFSVGVGDAAERVEKNLSLAAAALGIELGQLYFLSQVHGVDVVRVFGNETPGEVVLRQGDAVMSTAAELGCAVRTADCVPILMGDQRSGAACAIHAGWRGVEAAIVPAAIQRLREAVQDEGDLVAAIGPHISTEAFEVSDDVAERLARATDLPDIVDRSRTKPHVDLRRIVRAQLLRCGLTTSAVDDVPGCTFLDPERYFSFRRDGAASGRHLHVIVPRPG